MIRAVWVHWGDRDISLVGLGQSRLAMPLINYLSTLILQTFCTSHVLSTHMWFLYRAMYVCIGCSTDTIRESASSHASRRTSWSIRCISLISKVNMIVILRWLRCSIASYEGGSTINSQPLHPFLMLPFWEIFVLTCWTLIPSYAIVCVLASNFFNSLLIFDSLSDHALGFWVLEVANVSSIFRTYWSMRINAWCAAWNKYWTRHPWCPNISSNIRHLPIVEIWLSFVWSSFIWEVFLYLIFSHVTTCSSSHESARNLSTIVLSMIILSWCWSKLVIGWSYTCCRLLTTEVSVRWLIAMWVITVSTRACW